MSAHTQLLELQVGVNIAVGIIAFVLGIILGMVIMNTQWKMEATNLEYGGFNSKTANWEWYTNVTFEVPAMKK